MIVGTAQQAIIGGHHFDPREFDAHLASHGSDALLRRSIACPCIDPVRGSPDPSCTVCDGRGAHYYEAAPTPLRVYATRKLMRQLERQGTWVPGIADFTFPSTVLLKVFDSFEIPVDHIVVDDVLKKGDINVLTGESREQLRFPTILAIEYAAFVVRTPATGTPYTSSAVPLVEDTHFTRSGRRLHWTTAGNAVVPDGTTYTVRYQTQATWIIWAPRNRTENNVRQPPTFECRRLDYVHRAQGEATDDG